MWLRCSFAAALWLGAALPVLAGAADGLQRHQGACSVTAPTGETLFAGDCAITRSHVAQLQAGTHCAYTRYEVLYPGIGLGVALRPETAGCAPQFQDQPADFLAMDKRGQLVMATAAGALFRFDPGPPDPAPPAPLPVLDDFLRGIEACDFSPAYDAFARSLWEAFPAELEDPDGLSTTPAAGAAILWPADNPPPLQPVRARKTGYTQHLDVPLRGTYHGLEIVGLRMEAGIGSEIDMESFLFNAPKDVLEGKFGASVRGKNRLEESRNFDDAPFLPRIEEGAPARLSCYGTE